MNYYLKKEWKANSLAVLLQIIQAGLCVLQNLLLIQVMQGIIHLDMTEFLRWALLHRRSILLVDEGTSALDQKNADIVEQSLLRNPDLTLILVSHHLSPERKAQFTRVFALEPAVSPAASA